MPKITAFRDRPAQQPQAETPGQRIDPEVWNTLRLRYPNVSDETIARVNADWIVRRALQLVDRVLQQNAELQRENVRLRDEHETHVAATTDVPGVRARAGRDRSGHARSRVSAAADGDS